MMGTSMPRRRGQPNPAPPARHEAAPLSVGGHRGNLARRWAGRQTRRGGGIGQDRGMRVLLLGATGMVGQGVLRECLLDDRVTSVVTISRTPVALRGPKLEQILLADVAELGSSTQATEALAGVDAVFYALGVSSVGRDEPAYTAVTYDLAMTIAQAIRLHAGQDVRFIYVSGSGTDATESGRTMWARVKGRTENDLRAMFPQAVMFRPGAIQPMHGERTKSVWIDRVYAVSRPSCRSCDGSRAHRSMTPRASGAP